MFFSISKEQILYYAKVAGWDSDKLVDLFCEWFDLEEGARGDLDFDQFLLSKLTEEQLAVVIADAMR